MITMKSNAELHIFSTCPQSKDWTSAEYRQRVIDVARWSEEAGCTGILVYTDNGIADPWLISQIIIEHTRTLCPLVAVQPVYMHPYAVAKMVATLGFVYNRRVYLNMVAGGFKNDLIALNDTTAHDKRYDRLTEYTKIISQLLRSDVGVTFEGEYYAIKNLRMTPSLPDHLFPGIFISGSSEAGIAAARNVQATAIQYPKPPEEYESHPPDNDLDLGIRIGIVARNEAGVAWDIARKRFPDDRKGQLTHQMAMKVSDSVWHKQLSDLATAPQGKEHPYWLVPFQNYKTNCPYLVGDYDTVATEVARYVRVGYRSIILDIPPNGEELQHINRVFLKAKMLGDVA